MISVVGKSPLSRDGTKDMTKSSPLPPIGKSRESSKAAGPVEIPAKVPIVLIMGKLRASN